MSRLVSKWCASGARVVYESHSSPRLLRCENVPTLIAVIGLPDRNLQPGERRERGEKSG
jgi:hypothetical protein